MALNSSYHEFYTLKQWDLATKSFNGQAIETFEREGFEPKIIWHAKSRYKFVPYEQTEELNKKLTWDWLDENCKHRYYIWNWSTIAFEDFDDCLIFLLKWI